MPVNDDLGGGHTTNKPHNYKSWDTRRVLLNGQLTLVYKRGRAPNLCDDKLWCVGDREEDGNEDS